MIHRSVWLLVAGVALFSTGCFSSSGPQPIIAPDVDPTEAAAQALKMCDANSDNVLSGDEIDKIPAITYLLSDYDTSGDGRVTEDELVARFKTIFESGAAMTTLTCRVTLNNRSLEGATVTFVPEPFLDENLKPAKGITDSQGIASIQVAAADLPEGNKDVAAVYMGIYKVQITHPSQKIPTSYSGDNTVLGVEVSGFALQGNDPIFALDKSGKKPKQVHPL